MRCCLVVEARYLSEVSWLFLVADSLSVTTGCRDAGYLLGWTGDVLQEDNRTEPQGKLTEPRTAYADNQQVI